MVAIFGLLLYGEEVNDLLSAEECVSLEFDSPSYGPFLQEYCETVGSVIEIKYTAFILYWLCRFIICPPTIGIMSANLRLVQAIVKGKKLALRSFNISLLYRPINDFISSSKSTLGGGPFWMLQIWFLAYFPEL